MFPRHGLWCGARAYPTRCRFCGASAFYFECGCGSRVFFDHLGDPWPRHECDGRRRHLSVREQIAANERRIAELEEEFAKSVMEAAQARAWEPIQKVSPQDGTAVADLGVVREFEPNVDVYKRSGVPRGGALATAFLGSLGRGNFVQLTVHTGALGSDQVQSFTFFVERQFWSKVKAGRGDLVSFSVAGEKLSNEYTFWRCTALSWVDE